ncbi:MAG: hypothetical protein OQL06_02935 [Gammaproteobacteria bacterium]|nr:hypothetical protein [Gammaproteobacteria bacterium]
MSLLTRKELEPEVFDKPRLVYVKPPQNAEEYRKIYKDMMHQDKKDIMFRTSRYLPVEDYLDRIYLFAINVNDISHSDMKQINNFIEQ